MIRVYSPVATITVERDARHETWRLSLAGGQAFALRPWSWSERRRLLECAVLGGEFDREVFVHGMLDALLAPAPEFADTTEIAFVCLYLLGIREDTRLLTVAETELLMARTFGWRPAELDAQPAAAVDRLIGQLRSETAPGDSRKLDEDWTRIALVEGRPSPPRQTAARLEAVLENLGRQAQRFPETGSQRSGSADAEALGESWTRIVLVEGPPSPPKETAAHLDATLERLEEHAKGFSVASGSGDVPRRPPHDSFTPTVPGAARLPRPRSSSSERSAPKVNREATETARAEKTFDRPAEWRVAEPVSAPSAVASEDFLPPVRVRVRWPEDAPVVGRQETFRRDADEAVAAEPGPVPSSLQPENPFRLSELEEQMADVLERAAREAGVDLR
ncbi:MAG: hypothetical protein WD696_11900 [Bryobacteraceae bacterium]